MIVGPLTYSIQDLWDGPLSEDVQARFENSKRALRGKDAKSLRELCEERGEGEDDQGARQGKGA